MSPFFRTTCRISPSFHILQTGKVSSGNTISHSTALHLAKVQSRLHFDRNSLFPALCLLIYSVPRPPRFSPTRNRSRKNHKRFANFGLGYAHLKEHSGHFGKLRVSFTDALSLRSVIQQVSAFPPVFVPTMGNLVTRMRSHLSRRRPESTEDRAIPDRFRWANEQGRSSQHFAEGGPLFRQLGTWPVDQSQPESGKIRLLRSSYAASD